MKEIDFKTKKALTDNDVISFYDAYASSWDGRFDNYYATNYFLERRWKSFVEAVDCSHINKSRIIELGVGTGIYIERVSKLFDSIIALDGSKNMIDILQDRVNRNNITNVSTMRANVVNLHAISTASADCVYFFGLIEHIIDTSSFLSEIKRVLKKGGVVIGITPNNRSPWYKLRGFIRRTGKHCSSDKYYSMDELNKLFEANGFDKVYASYWGAVPAGIDDLLAKLLSKIEPFFENTFLRCLLGSITFSYRR